jgi:hypothetical protein
MKILSELKNNRHALEIIITFMRIFLRLSNLAMLDHNYINGYFL